jgi:transcriptional regulator with XRE-family HTH domain
VKPNNDYKNPISERLYNKAAQRGMSIYELCKKTGHAEGKVAMAKRRENSFSSSRMLYDFAKALGTTTDYLISGKESSLDRDKIIQDLIKEKLDYKEKYDNLKKKVADIMICG